MIPIGKINQINYKDLIPKTNAEMNNFKCLLFTRKLLSRWIRRITNKEYYGEIFQKQSYIIDLEKDDWPTEVKFHLLWKEHPITIFYLKGQFWVSKNEVHALDQNEVCKSLNQIKNKLKDSLNFLY